MCDPGGMRSAFPSTLKSMLFPPLAGARGQSSVRSATPRTSLTQAAPPACFPSSTHSGTLSKAARRTGERCLLLVSLQRGLPDGVLEEYKQDTLECQVKSLLAIAQKTEYFSHSGMLPRDNSHAPPAVRTLLTQAP